MLFYIAYFCDKQNFIKCENIIVPLRALTRHPGLDVCFLKKKRWQIALLANIGFIIAFGIRCNFGAAKGRMINNFTDPFGNNHGVSYPAMHGVWRHWAPPMERSKLATTTFTGGYLGVMIGLPLSAYLVSYIDCAPSPEKSKSISDDEKRFIVEQLGQISSSPATLTTIPWKQILLSLPVWAIVISNFCRSWTFFLLLGNQLTYMKDVLHVEIHNVTFYFNFLLVPMADHGGLISSLPHALMSVVVLASGQLADYLRSTGKMSTQMVRKVFNTLEIKQSEKKSLSIG
ncbi:unnamed protein product [Gongylonema pulchrum]|uniref:Sialin n=1 Tax=Gongylonema pulchrum TaxID=637853 RepID=A0A183E5S3_9BILA|nr:unnamed protein product [Gongylonema pulchrum]